MVNQPFFCFTKHECPGFFFFFFFYFSLKDTAFVLAVLPRRRGSECLISMQSLPLSSSVERTLLLKHRSHLCLVCSEGEKLNTQIDFFLQLALPHPTGVGMGCPISTVVGPIAFFPTGTNLHGNCCSVLAGLF